VVQVLEAIEGARSNLASQSEMRRHQVIVSMRRGRGTLPIHEHLVAEIGGRDPPDAGPRSILNRAQFFRWEPDALDHLVNLHECDDLLKRNGRVPCGAGPQLGLSGRFRKARGQPGLHIPHLSNLIFSSENVSVSVKAVCARPTPAPSLTVGVSLYPTDRVGTTVENPTFEE
jgi:hypothetical protein